MITDRAKTYLRMFVGISILGYLVWRTEPESLAEQLAAANGWYFLVTFLIMLLDVPVRSWNWQYLLKPVGVNAPLGKLSYAYLTGGFWGCILPSSLSTDAARAAIAARVVPMSFSEALATVVSLNALGLFASALLGLMGAAWLYAEGIQREIAAVCAALFAGQVIAVLSILWLLGHARVWLLSTAPGGNVVFARMHRLAARFGAAFLPLDNTVVSRWRMISVAMVSQILRPVGLAFACMSVGAEVPMAILFMWLPLGTLVSLLPISIAGFGGKQAAYVAYFSLFGISPAVGLTISLIYQAMQLAADLVGGVIFAFSRSPRPIVLPREETASTHAPK